MRLRWVYTDQPFLPVGTGCVINNRNLNQDQESELTVGQFANVIAAYEQDARWQLPPLALGAHQCNPQWFATGEPWPTALPNTVYQQGWIPDCCLEDDQMFTFLAGSYPNLNGQPSSEFRQYAIPAVDADASTPFLQSVVANDLDGAAADRRGFALYYWPDGEAGSPQLVVVQQHGAGGVPESRKSEFVIDNNNSIREQQSALGYERSVEIGGDTGTLVQDVSGGVGRLTGSNMKIDPAILPVGVSVNDWSGVNPGAGTQTTVPLITGTHNLAIGTQFAGRGLRVANGVPGFRTLLYGKAAVPASVAITLWLPVGDRFAGTVVSSLTIQPGTMIVLQEVTGGGVWLVVQLTVTGAAFFP